MKTLEDCNTISEVVELIEAQDTISDKAKIAGGYAFDAANDQRDDAGGFVTTTMIKAHLEFLENAGCSFDDEFAVCYAGLHDADWHGIGALDEMNDEEKDSFLVDPEAWRDGLSQWPMWSYDLAFTLDDFLNAIKESLERG